ncbi:plexin-A1-like, partial [Centruroides vittatus]|uniref:plexin-A1-like n=2 Tax=Centruroides vittatus TaxID=120091 RepID=UPI00350FCB8A
CSLCEECAGISQETIDWLSYKHDKCITITKIQPKYIQSTTARTLALTINNLPMSEDKLFCAFKFIEQTLITNATRTASGVTCATPNVWCLPPIPSGHHNLRSRLYILDEKQIKYTSTNFTFFDCMTYTSCTQCVSSPFPCSWCIEGHRCTHNTDEYCRNDILITGISNLGPSLRSGPEFCPRIDIINGGSSSILVPHGQKKRIQVKVKNIMQLIAQTRFVCRIKIEGRIYQANAEMLGDTIYCDQITFSHEIQSGNVTASFDVIWDNSKSLDNPKNIHVIIYKCEKLATNCRSCLQLESKYKCGWCSDGLGSCHIREQCNSSLLSLDDYEKCPKRQKFIPSGPWENGENIIVTGINLGLTFSDISSNGIKILQNDGKIIANCTFHKGLHEKRTIIACQNEKLRVDHHDEHISDNIIFKIQNKESGLTKYDCSAISPKIVNITPSIGPKSGGTHLFIWGKYMNIAETVEAEIGDIPCHVIRRKTKVIECITSPSQSIIKDNVRIKFDNDFRISEQQFQYVDNPIITSVQSQLYNEKNVLKGIPSGGLTVYIEGTNLDAVESPKMYLIFENEKYRSNCTVKSPKEMECESPSIPYVVKDNEVLELDYGFEMDNVEEVKNMSSKIGFHKFQIYPDPTYLSFDDKNCIKNFRSDYLTILGKNLDYASEMDIFVRIGTEHCVITSISRSQLTCRPPASQPSAMILPGAFYKGNLPEVIVEVGSKLKFTIGWLRYTED